MSALFKSAADPVCRPLPAPSRRGAVAVSPPVDPRIAAMTGELELLRGELASEQDRTKGAIAAARDAGLRESAGREQDRLDALSAGIAQARADWRERLDAWDRLAALLSRAALAKLFGEHDDLADLVRRTLSRRVATMDAAVIVTVVVSTADFDDAAALQGLSGHCGLPATTIVADPNLEAGGCRIDLAMGHVDLSLPAQWAQIERRLAEIAGEMVDTA